MRKISHRALSALVLVFVAVVALGGDTPPITEAAVGPTTSSADLAKLCAQAKEAATWWTASNQEAVWKARKDLLESNVAQLKRVFKEQASSFGISQVVFSTVPTDVCDPWLGGPMEIKGEKIGLTQIDLRLSGRPVRLIYKMYFTPVAQDPAAESIEAHKQRDDDWADRVKSKDKLRLYDSSALDWSFARVIPKDDDELRAIESYRDLCAIPMNVEFAKFPPQELIRRFGFAIPPTFTGFTRTRKELESRFGCAHGWIVKDDARNIRAPWDAVVDIMRPMLSERRDSNNNWTGAIAHPR